MCLFLFSFLSQFCVILFFLFLIHTRVTCAHFSHHLRANRERERKEKLVHTLHTCKFSPFRHIHIYTITFFSFSLPSHLFLFDTHTVSWLLCVCIDVFFFSLDSRAQIHTHTHKQVVICIFMPSFLSPHCLLASSRVFFFSCMCVRGPVCTFFVFFFSFFFFFSYNANIMSAARPIDSRQLHALRS